MLKKLTVAVVVLASLGIAGWLPVTSQRPAQPTVRIITQGSSATVIDITVPGLETETETVGNEEFTILRLPGEPALTADIGQPQLPRIIRNLAIPDNAQLQVEVLEAECRTITGILVYPVQKPLTDMDEFQFTIDRNFYAKDLTYPDVQASIELQSTWRGLPFATVELNPVRYNPARRELTVCSHLRVRLNHQGVFVRHEVEPWEVRQAAGFIDNPERLNLDVHWFDSPGVRYLVIAHSNYVGGWLDSLVNWHHRRGVETRVIAKSSWTDTEVKDSVRAEYERNNPKTLRWVLLVGEYNEVPGHAYPGVGYSDVWYTDLEPTGGDDYFDLGIGRFSPSSTTDLGNQIQKTLLFQRNPPPGNWFSKVTLAAHSEQYPQKYSACTRGIYHFPYAYYRYTFDTIMGGAGGTNAMVSADINEGRVVVNYRGHGSETDWSSWCPSGSWTANNINALTNADMTPVVFNCCCLNHVLSTATCLGEAWMRKFPGGAVASLGATEASYTIPNHAWDSTLFRSLGDTFTISIPGVRNYTCPIWDLGWMLNNANAYIQKYYSGSGGTDNARMYLWLGDPALGVWTGEPLTADAVYPPTVPLGNYDLVVTVTRQGTPVPNALVCAWKSSEVYAYGYTNSAGTVTLAINATSPGDIALTITGHTIRPHLGTILARTAGSPYVTYLRSVVNDSPPRGNGDGCINPGEQIILPVWVKNHGDSIGRSVIGKLRISDGYVTLTDSVKNFGNVPAHDSAYTGPAGYGFTVASACTNGHYIHFTLQCRDVVDSVWNSHIYLRVGAPYLGYAGQQVNDTIVGGNRNGRLDPNETAELAVSLRNTGFGHANNVTAILRSGDARLIVLDSLGTYGQIMAESTRTNTQDWFRVQTFSMPPEIQIPCTLLVRAQGGYATVVPFYVPVGAVRNCDPIPDGPRQPVLYWAYDDQDTLYDQRPEYAWVEIRTQGTRLNFSHNDAVIVVDLPPAFGPFKYYGQRYTQLSVSADGWIVPGSYTTTNYTNSGLPGTAAPPGAICANWDDLYPGYGSMGYAYYYHDAANHRFIVEFDSAAYYDQTSVRDKFEFIFYDTTLASPTGNSQFLMQYMTANRYTSNTVGIQDQSQTIGIQCLYDGNYHRGCWQLAPRRAILYSTDPPTGVAEPAAGPSPEQLAVRLVSNPFVSGMAVLYSLPGMAQVELAVYDGTGRKVRTLVSGEQNPGRYRATWDGCDDSGQRLAAGIYWLRLIAGGDGTTVKAVKLR
ncbi:MAG: C25 family cysteine peptidase [candidate division WOR-3 bacterium]